MNALLRLGLLLGMLLCCVGMIRHAYRPDAARLSRMTRWLRGLMVINSVLLLAWLIKLALP
jgi:hypothetical protein